MTRKKKKSDPHWARAKKLCRLNARQVNMAKELGMNPKKLPSLIPSKSQPWKAPVGIFIETCHAKRLGKKRANSRTGDRAEASGPKTDDSLLATAAGIVDELYRIAKELDADLADRCITLDQMSALANHLRRLADEVDEEPATPTRLEAFDDIPF